jgi:large subunit ribosomal protein L31
MIIPVEISSASHPFFTGKQVLMDTSARLKKFQARADKKTTTRSKTEKKAARKTKKTETI